MTTLQFDVPLCPEPVSYQLALPTGYERNYHFIASEVLNDSDSRSEVFRGNISDDRYPNGVVVICKLVRGDLTRLKLEAQFYSEQLKPLQRIYVPHFFGLYLGTHLKDGVEMPIGCIILQDCGNPIAPGALGELRTLTRAMKALVMIHAAGVEHNDCYNYDFHHIIVSPKNPHFIRIVDFDEALPHQCEAKPIEIWGYKPKNLGCRELHTVGSAMGVWTPTRIFLMSRPYCIFRGASIARLALLAQHEDGQELDSEEGTQYYRDKAGEVLDRYYDVYGDRFPTIRHPLEFQKPLGIAGVDEPPFLEYGGVFPWETPEWKQWREELAKDPSKWPSVL